MTPIRVAIIGLGNCASALIQGIYYYRQNEKIIGLMHRNIGPYGPSDIEIVAAYDIDVRKINRDINEAIFRPPNCTTVFCPELPPAQVIVQRGAILDGFSEHLSAYPESKRCVPETGAEPELDAIVHHLKQTGTEVVVNYLPVGSQRATEFYAECALQAGCAFINNIPVFIASHPVWNTRFRQHGLPLVGDDIKSQVGATITHRMLAELFHKRGVKLDRTYQLNTGGNTDFLNMLNRARLASKKLSKTEAVQAAVGERLPEDNIHIGPSDYVPWQQDNKIAFVRMEGRIFGDVPINLEMRLSVEDSPNSAGVAIDAIRCAKLGLANHLSGVLPGPCAYFCKHPPTQMSDGEAWQAVEHFILENSPPN